MAPYLVPSVGIVVIVGLLVLRLAAIRRTDDRYAGHQVSRLASAMGLTIEEGEPRLTLMLAGTLHATKDFEGGEKRTRVVDDRRTARPGHALRVQLPHRPRGGYSAARQRPYRRGPDPAVPGAARTGAEPADPPRSE